MTIEVNIAGSSRAATERPPGQQSASVAIGRRIGGSAALGYLVSRAAIRAAAAAEEAEWRRQKTGGVDIATGERPRTAT